jgi:hypothetical protein
MPRCTWATPLKKLQEGGQFYLEVADLGERWLQKRPDISQKVVEMSHNNSSYN